MRRNLLSKVKEKNGSGLFGQFKSKVTLTIELPLPVKRFYEFYLTVMKVLTGEDKATWKDFVTGKKVSKAALKVSFMFSLFLYTSVVVLALAKPSLLPYFWIAACWFLNACRYEIFTHSSPRGIFFMIDYCYFSAALMSIMFISGLDKNPVVYATVFALQTGASLMSVFLSLGLNSITFSSSSSISHMQLVFLHYVPSLVLFFDLRYKQEEEPWTYLEILSKNKSSQKILMNHFVIPFTVITLWQLSYLLLTEIIYYRKINNTLSPHYTQTNYNLGYFRKKKHKGLQKRMEGLFKRILVLKKTRRFVPEKKYTHHVMAIALYNIGEWVGMFTLLPLSYLYLQTPPLFGFLLLIGYFIMVFNGSVKMENERKYLKGEFDTPVSNIIEVNSYAETDTEDLDEGGSLNNDPWYQPYKDRLIVRKSSRVIPITTKKTQVIEEEKDNKSDENDPPPEPEALNRISPEVSTAVAKKDL